MILNSSLDSVGNTPMVKLDVDNENVNLFAKLELFNPTGSVKDRAASYIIEKKLEMGKINMDSTVIESSSGNFGVALAAYCKRKGLKFIAVVDPHITLFNEMLIRSFGATVIKVTEPDVNGGYLLHRVEKVKQLLTEIEHSYWVNQYANPYNADAYYHSLGEEICNSLDSIDYVFMGISSGGTITGVSRKIKERFPDSKVVAVDIVGSVIFGNPAQKRYIPGIGSSMVPKILKLARIDEVVMMDEVETIKMCHELLKEHFVLAGGSAGSAYGAVKKYFADKPLDRNVNVVTVFADRGERYANTIYNEEWYTHFFENHAQMKSL